jgi:hypothetical protein
MGVTSNLCLSQTLRISLYLLTFVFCNALQKYILACVYWAFLIHAGFLKLPYFLWLIMCIKVKKSKAAPLRSTEAHLGDRRYSSCSFLTSALEGGEWSASRPGRALPPGERALGTHCIGGWVGPRACLEKSSASVGDRTPAVQSVVRHYTD